MVNSSEFARRLELIFEYYDLNASGFADKIDVGRASISHLLSGRNKPSLDFVMRIIKTFPEVELYWLLNGKGRFPNIDGTEDGFTSSSPIPPKKEDASENENQSEKTILPKNLQSDDVERIVIFFKNGSFTSFTPK